MLVYINQSTGSDFFFKPVAGADVLPDGKMIQTQIMSISESPEFGKMSHEVTLYMLCSYSLILSISLHLRSFHS